MAFEAGTTLGPYEVTGPLGVGGMGEVYRARDTKLNRDVALKVLPEVFVTDPERPVRFQREAEVLALLNHPNIANQIAKALEAAHALGIVHRIVVVHNWFEELKARVPVE